MVIGDPYKFSVLFDRVKSWNVSINDDNGFFGVSIDGKIFPDMVINAIIPVSLLEIKNSLNSIPINEDIYNLGTSDAFKALYNLVYPQSDDYNDYRYELATADLTDHNNLVFAVAGKEKVKIFAAELKYDIKKSCHIFDESALQTAVLDKSEVSQIIKEIEEIIKAKYTKLDIN